MKIKDTLRINTISGILYVVLGVPSLWFSHDPFVPSLGYPSIGWALVAVLWFGLKVLPGMALGVLALHLAMSAWLGWSGALTLSVTGVIGLGVLLQLLLTRHLIKRWMGNEWQQLSNLHALLKFNAIVLVSVAFLSVWNGTLMPWVETGFYDHLTVGMAWYTSTVLGMVVLAPLSLCGLSSDSHRIWLVRKKWFFIPILLLSTIGFLWSNIIRYNQEIEKSHLNELTKAVGGQIEDRLLKHAEKIKSLESLIQVRPNLTFSEFEKFALNLLKDTPDLLALSLNKTIKRDERLAFEKKMQGMSFVTDYHITEKDNQGRLIRAGDHTDHVAVQYVVPVESNQKAIGFDIQSEPIRRVTIQRALASGQIAVTGPVQLVQEQQSNTGILELLPFTRTTDPHAKDSQRIDFFAGVVRIDRLLEKSVHGYLAKGIKIELFDPDAVDSPGLLYRSDFFDDPGYQKSSVPIMAADKTWQLTVAVPMDTTSSKYHKILVDGLVMLFMLGSTTLWLQFTNHTRNLEEGEEQYHALFDNSPLPKIVYAVDSQRILMVNDAACAFYGFSKERLLQTSLSELLAPGALPYWLDTEKTPLSQAYSVKSLQRRHDDSTCEVRVFAKPEILNGAHVQVQTVYDLSTEKEEQTRQALLELRKVIDSIVGSDPIFYDEAELNICSMAKNISQVVLENEFKHRELLQQKHALDQHAIVSKTDLNGVINYASDSFCAISEYRREELIGHRHNIVKSGVHPTTYFRDLWLTIKQGKVWHGEICNRSKSGKLYWVRSTVVPLTDEYGLIREYISIRTDITKERNIQQELEKAKETAEMANRAKSDFLANMSHEIRTPLNAILGLTQVLERSRLDDNQAEMISKIKGAGQVLLRNLNDVLDFSKIEAGQMSLEIIPFNLNQVLSGLYGIQNMAAQEAGLLFRLNGPDENLIVEGDSTRIWQILLNLVGNAMKFTTQGGVTLNTKVMAKTDHSCRVRFEIIDTGIGISAEKIAALFKPFSQADGSVTRKFGGTGLGLSICKLLVDMMEGSIGVSSQEGQGSTFWFEIPFKLSDEQHLLLSEKDNQAEVLGGQTVKRLMGRHILIVDDSEMNRYMMQRMLEAEGADMTFAVDGQQALDILAAGEVAFDVILMDIQMPVMSGFEATRLIRQDIKIKDIPIIMCSAGVNPEEKKYAMSMGANEFVTKPVNLELLISLLHKVPAPTGSAHSSTPVDKVPQLPWPKIDGIDTDKVRTGLDDDIEFYFSMLAILEQELKKTIECFPAYLADKDFELAKKTLHKLRGSAGALSASELMLITAEFEKYLDVPQVREVEMYSFWNRMSVVMKNLLINIQRELKQRSRS